MMDYVKGVASQLRQAIEYLFKNSHECLTEACIPQIEFKNMKSQQKHKKKRHRSAFTTDQINYLENEFKKCPYVGITSRNEIAHALNLSETAIKIWFQNRRMKAKKCSDKETNIDMYNQFNHSLANDPVSNFDTITLVNDLSQHLETSVRTANYLLQRENKEPRNYVINNKQEKNITIGLPKNRNTNPYCSKFLIKRPSKLSPYSNITNDLYEYNNDKHQNVNIKHNPRDIPIRNNFSLQKQFGVAVDHQKIQRNSGMANKKPELYLKSHTASNCKRKDSIRQVNLLSEVQHYTSRDILNKRVKNEAISRFFTPTPKCALNINTKNESSLNRNCSCDCWKSRVLNSDVYMSYMFVIPFNNFNKNVH